MMAKAAETARAAETLPTRAGQENDATPSRAWRLSFAVYLRLLALVLLAAGILQWGYVIGAVSLPPAPFLELRPPVRNAVAVIAAANLVAAVGLWFAAAWGIAFGLIVTAASVALHTVFADVHGARPVVVALQGAAVFLLVALWLMSRREARREDEASRNRRRQRSEAA